MPAQGTLQGINTEIIIQPNPLQLSDKQSREPAECE